MKQVEKKEETILYIAGILCGIMVMWGVHWLFNYLK